MILWIVKLISSLRRALAGRKYPAQLAWAVAFGLLLGVVPHGNLLAIVILLVVLSLKINHAMAGLTAVGATFVATRLDPYSHQVGDYVLTHPQISETAVAAWQLPLMPWTDLNNTVVMGSFLIGVGALVPVFALTYPVFRWMAPAPELEENDDEPGGRTARPSDIRPTNDASHDVVLIDSGHRQLAPPHQRPEATPQRVARASSDHGSGVEFIEVDGEASDSDPEPRVAVETRIDVIRMKDHVPTDETMSVDDSEPMDEALNYLLRQLRDSQQRKAA